MKKALGQKHLLGLVALAMVCVLLGTGIGFLGAGNAVALEGGTKLEGVVESPFTAAVEAVHASVVGITTYKTYQASNYGNYFGFGFDNRGNNRSQGETREVEAASGSGTVISAAGHVLTNYHVVEGASRVTVKTDAKTYEAEVVAFDVDLDIAILLAKDLRIQPVSLGDSDALRIGDWAICIGNPLSFEGTTTVGIVSGLNRSISTGSGIDKYGRRTETVSSMIQVDASINSGNSGGGMFNVLGELVGIPTIKYSSSGYFSSASIEGIGMCIPINIAKPLIEKVLSGEIKAQGSPAEQTTAPAPTANVADKPRMGIAYSTIDGTSFNSLLPSGAYVSKVEEGSPAQAAGLLPGDIIVEADETLIGQSTEGLQAIITAKNEGEQVALTVYRAEGLNDVMTRYFNRETIGYADIPTDGEYVDLTVTLKIIPETVAQ